MSQLSITYCMQVRRRIFLFYFCICECDALRKVKILMRSIEMQDVQTVKFLKKRVEYLSHPDANAAVYVRCRAFGAFVLSTSVIGRWFSRRL